MCIYMETNPVASAIRGKLVARRPSATRVPHGRARNPRQTRRPPLPAKPDGQRGGQGHPLGTKPPVARPSVPAVTRRPS